LFIFLLVFISIYSGLHVYALAKTHQALALNPGATYTLAAFLLLMIFSPILVRLLESVGFETTGRSLAYIGYTWMGLLFLFVSSSFVFDIYRLLLAMGRFVFQTDLSGITLTHRLSFYVSVALSVLITLYGSIEANRIQTERITIQSPKIPKSVGRLRIAQISDVHLGLIVGEKRLQKILAEVKSAKPDMLVSTGDLVDGQMDNLESLARMFNDVSTRYGKYAVTGNHEFYAGASRALNFTEKAGFAPLRGESREITDFLTVAGVDDEAGVPYGLVKDISESQLLSQLPDDHFILFLKHRPLLDPDAAGHFDLQLSGHVHKGQIFPFSLVTMLFYPEDAGLLKLKGNAALYVNRGSGTWGPPIRFLSPPEVTVIDLVHENRK